MYEYQRERPSLFTEDGVKVVIAIRDHVQKLLKMSGACTVEKAIEGASGEMWTRLAALDYLVEQRELVIIEREGIARQFWLVTSRYFG